MTSSTTALIHVGNPPPPSYFDFSFPDISFLKDNFIYNYISDAGENVSFYANKLKLAENTGQLYKLVPLTMGTYFGYQGLKNLTRGTLGYDSWSARVQMFQKAVDQKDLPYSERLSFIRDSVFGSMPGKQRAIILARAIANTLVAGALIYPFFVIDTDHPTDLNERASSFPHDKNYLDGTVMGRGRDHELDVAATLYAQQAPTIKAAILNPKMAKKTTDFAEAILNPNTAPLANSIKDGIKKACNWTLGLTAYSTACDKLSGSAYTPLFQTGTNDLTKINTKVLNQACDDTQAYITTSAPDLSTQTADFLGSACEYTWGHTPWGKQCEKIRESFETPSAANRTKVLSAFTNQFCSDLKERAGLEKAYSALFDIKAPYSESEVDAASQAILKLGTKTLQVHTTSSGVSQTQLGLIANQHPKEFVQFVKSYMNITESTQLNQKVISKANGQIQKKGHPDKVKANDTHAKDLAEGSKTITALLKENPNLYTGRTTHTFSELGKKIQSFLEE